MRFRFLFLAFFSVIEAIGRMPVPLKILIFLKERDLSSLSYAFFKKFPSNNLSVS